MMFPTLFLLTFLSINNYRKAQAIGLNPMAWVLYTALAFSIGIFLACMLLGIIIMIKYPEVLSFAESNNRKAMNQLLITQFSHNTFLYSSLIMAGAFGGYLLVKYLLDKKALR